MFIYNFKENKMPEISAFKENLENELNSIKLQKNHVNNIEEMIYKNFIDLSVQTYLNFDNAYILTEFNNAFSLIANISNNLNMIENHISEIIELINSTNFEENFNQDEFLKNLQTKLENYYSIKNAFQNECLENENKLYMLMLKLNSYVSSNDVISAPGSEITVDFVLPKEPILKETEIKEVKEEAPIDNNEKNIKNKEIKNDDNNKEEKINEIKKADKIEKDIKPLHPTEKVAEKNIDTKKVDVKTDDSKPKKNEKINEKKDEIKGETKKETKKPKKNLTKKVPDDFVKDNRLLLISEKDNKVCLPYFYTDLKAKLIKSSYDSIQELIDTEYVLPLSDFKNPLISRFKQGFNLMRKKEHTSVKQAIALGFELMGNYNLHPAVIAACRNLDELESFLDCIDQNTLDTFDLFDIKFEVVPTIKK